MSKLIVLIIISLLTVACSTTPIPTSSRPYSTTPASARYEPYSEDLSLVRPRYQQAITDAPKANTPQMATTDLVRPVNQQIDAVLDTIAIQNKTIRYAVGYRIQIYVGNVRAEADEAKVYVYQTFPELLPYMSFAVPTYRVKIGDFMTKIDAERYLQQVRPQFPTAVILAEKIDIRKSLQTK